MCHPINEGVEPRVTDARRGMRGKGRREESGFNSELKSPRETSDVTLAEQVLRRQEDLAHQWAVCSSSSEIMSEHFRSPKQTTNQETV